MGGAHEHRCANPHGLEFVIGGFATAENLAPHGNPSTYFTWFPGYAWQVQHCAACRLHLGWRFTSADGGFFGLILANLVPE